VGHVARAEGLSVLLLILLIVLVVGAVVVVAAVQQVRKIKMTAVDPYAVQEPWRGLVQRAVTARKQFDLAIEGLASGPLRERLAEVGVRVGAAETEVFRLAKLGNAGADVKTRTEALVTQLEQGATKAVSLSAEAPADGVLDEVEALRQGLADVTGDTGAPGLPPPP
jgi:hypothetical protein